MDTKRSRARIGKHPPQTESPGGGITLRQVTRVNAAVLAALAAVLIAVVTATVSSSATSPLGKVNHIVVIYEENHSFDNLYGGWEGVNGLSGADAAHTTQVNEAGNPYTCLKQNDANLQDASRFPRTCSDATAGTPGGPFTSAFTNAPFTIDHYIPPTDTTCPPNPALGFSSPGGNGWISGTGAAGGC